MNKQSNGSGERSSNRKLKVSIETIRRLTDLQSGQVVGGWVKTEGW